MKPFFPVAAAALLWISTMPAMAADESAASPQAARKATPEQQARREQWCKANPEKCKALQARQAQCKADPEKCKAERQARMKER